MDSKDREEILKMIKDSGQQNFSARVVGDTPTDVNQLSPKKYVTSVASAVFASVQAGLTINGNLKVSGSSSFVGVVNAANVFATNLNLSGNASVAGTGAFGGNIATGGNASVGGTVFASGGTFGTLTSEGLSVPRTYYGVVSSGGVDGSPFPSGWAASIIATGTYKITHGFGATNYAVGLAAGTYVATINAKATNDFTIKTLDPAGAAQNDNFDFIVERP